ncbi:unnamed protein product [Caenorhabditis angaria]|uniref:PWWP domain-containing protein n=1 Tax=Caenorhabditis angaria TaxID=860376 RepID=A0A9P1J705_9PELO|nr:unnamed protein product [Caenorhabditis angaria]
MSTNHPKTWCDLNCDLHGLLIDNWPKIEEVFRQYSTPTNTILISMQHDDMFQVIISSVLEGSRILKFTAIKLTEKLIHMFGAHPFLKETVPEKLLDALAENTRRIREFRFLKRNGPSFQDPLETGESSSAQSNNIDPINSILQNGNEAQEDAPVNDNVRVVVEGLEELEDVKDFGELIRKQKELENQAKLNAQAVGESSNAQAQPEDNTGAVAESSRKQKKIENQAKPIAQPVDESRLLAQAQPEDNAEAVAESSTINGKPEIAENIDSVVGNSSSNGNGSKSSDKNDTVAKAKTTPKTPKITKKSPKVHDFAAEQVEHLFADEPEEANLSDDETYYPNREHKKKKKRHSRKRKRQQEYHDEDTDEDDLDYSEEGRGEHKKKIVKSGPTPAKKRSYEQPKQRYSEGRPPSLAVTRNPYNTVRFDSRLVEEPDDDEAEEAVEEQQQEVEEPEETVENNVVEEKETEKDSNPEEVQEEEDKKPNQPEKSNDEPVPSTSRAYQGEPVDVTIDGNQNKKLKKYNGMLFDQEALDILYPEKEDDFNDLTSQIYDEEEIARLDQRYARHQSADVPAVADEVSTLMGETVQELLDMNKLKNIDFGLTGEKMKLQAVYEMNNQVMLNYLNTTTPPIEWLSFYKLDKNSHFPDAALYITKEMMTDSYEKIYGAYYSELFEQDVDTTDAELLFKYILARQIYVSNLRFPNGRITEFEKFNYGKLKDAGSTFVFPGGDRVAIDHNTRYTSNSFLTQQNWKNFKIGSMVWVRFKSKWWPAYIVAFESNNGAFGLPILSKPKHGPVIVKNELLIHVKYPDGACSYMNIGMIDHFTTNFCIRFDPTNGSTNYVSSVAYCINQLRQVGYFEEHISYKVGNALLNYGWDFNYLPPYQHKRIFCQNTVQGLPDPMILMEMRTKYAKSVEEKSTAKVKDLLYSPFSFTEKSIKKYETGRREMAAAHNIDLHHFHRYLEANGGTMNAAPIMYRVTGCVAKVMDKYKPWGYNKNEDLEEQSSKKSSKKEE